MLVHFPCVSELIQGQCSNVVHVVRTHAQEEDDPGMAWLVGALNKDHNDDLPAAWAPTWLAGALNTDHNGDGHQTEGRAADPLLLLLSPNKLFKRAQMKIVYSTFLHECCKIKGILNGF